MELLLSLLATHRIHNHQNQHDGSNSGNAINDRGPFFPYEYSIAAVAIAFFRLTLIGHDNEPKGLRWFFSALLALLAYTGKSYELILAVELFSYVIVYWWLYVMSLPRHNKYTGTQRFAMIAGGAILCLLLAHALTTGVLFRVMTMMTPSYVVRVVKYLFPVDELREAINMMLQLSLEPEILTAMFQHLFFVTAHIQIGIGFLGIHFLTKQQSRRNLLVRLDVDEAPHGAPPTASNGHAMVTTPPTSHGKTSNMMDRARSFKKGAAAFIFGVAMPYMIQVIIFGNVNKYAFMCVKDDLHRNIRIRQVFARKNRLAALATNSTTAPEAYAAAMSKVFTTTYEIFNRKLFSLPKVLLLPQIFALQPQILVQAFPFIFLSDWLKANADSFMTTMIEKIQKELIELNGVQTKVEAFDLKNAELLQRSGIEATSFTHLKWDALTRKVQTRNAVADILTRSKEFFSFMQHHFVFVILIDCALADMIAVGKMTPSDIFVFSRAIEDAVDLILIRSRSEADLARMKTEIGKLERFYGVLQTNEAPRLMPCSVESTATDRRLVLRNLHYSRGSANARADHLELTPGVYALTGANGSGKSTLFRLLMSCSSNENPIDLPVSINLHSPSGPLEEEASLHQDPVCLDGEDISNDAACSGAVDPVDAVTQKALPKAHIVMPDRHIVEITQHFYWPLHTRPIDWIEQRHHSDQEDLGTIARKIAGQLHSLEFFQVASLSYNATSDDVDDFPVSDAIEAEATISKIADELLEEKEDWFQQLSGGQRSKVELVRLVFLRDECPAVLLIDETLAPLDPRSKQLVMTKIKLFCSNSIIIVIYHADVGTDDEKEACIASSNFFDRNIHLENGDVHIRDVC